MKIIKKITIAVLLFVVNLSNAQDESIIRLPSNIAPKDRIAFAMYTIHENTLKLTAQFHPLKNYTPFRATLEIEENGIWVEKAKADIIYPGYTAPFRIENWDEE